MFLAKIKNKFMYKTDSDDCGSHWYLVYTRRNKFLYCKQVTHMYLPDSKRFYQKNIGLLEERKITSFDTPQGVYKRHIKNGAYNVKLSLKNIKRNAVEIRYYVKTKKL